MENIRYVGSQKGYFISSLEFMSASQKTIVNCLNSQYIFQYNSECFNENKKLVIKKLTIKKLVSIFKSRFFLEIYRKKREKNVSVMLSVKNTLPAVKRIMH